MSYPGDIRPNPYGWPYFPSLPDGFVGGYPYWRIQAGGWWSSPTMALWVQMPGGYGAVLHENVLKEKAP